MKKISRDRCLKSMDLGGIDSLCCGFLQGHPGVCSWSRFDAVEVWYRDCWAVYNMERRAAVEDSCIDLLDSLIEVGALLTLQGLLGRLEVERLSTPILCLILGCCGDALHDYDREMFVARCWDVVFARVVGEFRREGFAADAKSTDATAFYFLRPRILGF